MSVENRASGPMLGWFPEAGSEGWCMTESRAQPREPKSETGVSRDAAELYLELLKRCLTRYLWEETLRPYQVPAWGGPLKRWLKRRMIAEMRARGIEPFERVPFERAVREMGRDWPADAETMIGLRRLDHLHACPTCGIWRYHKKSVVCGFLSGSADTQRDRLSSGPDRGMAYKRRTGHSVGCCEEELCSVWNAGCASPVPGRVVQGYPTQCSNRSMRRD